MKNYELKKHVGTIHSSNKLTLLQRKIANALLFNAYDDLLTKDEYQINIKILCDLIGYDSHDHKTIKQALINLLASVIEWNLIDKDKLEDKGIWNASSIIADASIEGSTCTYSYSNKMKTLLYRPELYGRLNMLVQAKFKSSYGLALYENCIRYQNIERTPWFNMPIFRKLMGVEENKYSIFRDFKRRVLDKAIEEVNTYAPIEISALFQKKNREIQAIQFLIKANNKMVIADTPKEEILLNIRLQEEYGFSNQQIDSVLCTYAESYILEKIKIIEASTSFKNGKIANLAKYLINALEENYQSTKSSKDRLNEQQLKKTKQIELKKWEQIQKEEYEKYQDRYILNNVLNFANDEKSKYLECFVNDLKKNHIGLYTNNYLKSGMQDILVTDYFCQFIKKNYRDLLITLPTFKDFCKGSYKKLREIDAK